VLDMRIEPPIEIHTISHTLWQQTNLSLPKSVQDAATVIIKEKLNCGLLKYSQGPYCSRYFLVSKKVPGD
jgi:hypothetical protein